MTYGSNFRRPESSLLMRALLLRLECPPPFSAPCAALGAALVNLDAPGGREGSVEAHTSAHRLGTEEEAEDASLQIYLEALPSWSMIVSVATVLYTEYRFLRHGL